MKPSVSVVLVRGIAEQVSGGGCCGLWHHDPATRSRGLSCGAQRQQRELGLLHQAIRRSFPEVGGAEQVALVAVDPRNLLYLAPKLLGDVVRYRPGWRAGLQTVLQMFSVPAVILNGRPPDAETLCGTIAQLLTGAGR